MRRRGCKVSSRERRREREKRGVCTNTRDAGFPPVGVDAASTHAQKWQVMTHGVWRIRSIPQHICSTFVIAQSPPPFPPGWL